ncbi:MAG TPA: hypothetical protein PLH49_12100 [Chitinophagaceae bacterium]|mgnify:FL=1|nr:hypothetical protein [Chitinophagaceae bacterium]
MAFKGGEKLEAGLYFLKAGKNNTVALFLIDDSNQIFQLDLSMDTESKGLSISSVTNSKENNLFSDLSNFISGKKGEYNKLNNLDTAGQNKLTQQVRDYQQQLIENQLSKLP